jgi:hypothetical protein
MDLLQVSRLIRSGHRLLIKRSAQARIPEYFGIKPHRKDPWHLHSVACRCECLLNLTAYGARGSSSRSMCVSAMYMQAFSQGAPSSICTNICVCSCTRTAQTTVGHMFLKLGDMVSSGRLVYSMVCTCSTQQRPKLPRAQSGGDVVPHSLQVALFWAALGAVRWDFSLVTVRVVPLSHKYVAYCRQALGDVYR